MRILKNLLVYVLVVFPLHVSGADAGPEEVYAEFHKATLNADLETLKKYGTANMEMESLTPEIEQGLLAMMAMMTPKTYKILNKEIGKESGKLFLISDEEDNKVKGTVSLSLENGQWKVAEVKWSENFSKKFEIDLDSGAMSEIVVDEKTYAPTNQVKVRGKLNNQDFIVESVTFKQGKLTLRQGQDFFADREIVIFFLNKRTDFEKEGRLVVQAKDDKAPHIHMKYKREGESVPESKIFLKGYSMTVELKNKQGSIDLRLPDDNNSFVSGTFTIE